MIVGAYGTLIGAGGGFILVPILLLLYPSESPEVITAISLAVVFFNALSGSFAYGKMRWIAYRSGILLAVATIPGAILGAISSAYATRQFFDFLFGFLLLAGALYLFLKRNASNEGAGSGASEKTIAFRESIRRGVYPFNWKIGVISSFFVGYASSLLGIGGGIIHVPIMVHLLNFPIKIAAATSLFIIVIRSLAGTVTHIPMGSFSGALPMIVCLSIGVIIGAQLGALMSARIHSRWVLHGLTLAIIIVGVRLIAAAV